jgi:hypothetical protein
MPVWCFLMTFGVFTAVGREIELLWLVAVAVSLIVAGVCFRLREQVLAIYCIGTSMLVLAVAIGLPSLQRAT